MMLNRSLPIDTPVNQFDSLGRLIYEDYDQKKPFSSFLPGIAGLLGIPMWVFYVNRGQAVCSFGIKDKDHPILEFQSANIAYRTTERSGFRTFINGLREGQRWEREVFSPWGASDVKRRMFIGLNEVEIQEVNTLLGYQVNVQYFILPNLPFSGLVRTVTFLNLFSSPLHLEVLEGLPGIVPYGINDGTLKTGGRTIEAWMQAENIENRLPFFRLKATPGDTVAVHEIEAGNYALAYFEGGQLDVIVDPSIIFGLDTSFSRAHIFHDQGLVDVLRKPQILEGRYPCVFFGTNQAIDPESTLKITSYYGHSESLKTIHAKIDLLGTVDFAERKIVEARKLTQDLTDPVDTVSSSLTFDQYCRQTFLDNSLRGGIPLVLGDRNITHVYSRKHGDIERDYNYFVIAPEYFSQGNGNYRDINQNRRSDVHFVPQSGEFNIRLFMSLIQGDGYNPLVINGLTFFIPEERLLGILTQFEKNEKLTALLKSEFTPGQLAGVIQLEHESLSIEEILYQVFANAEPIIQADHGEGFWIDHWTYNLDLIEAFLSIYPDQKEKLLFESEPIPFYDNANIVQTRKERFVLYDDKPRQMNSVIENHEKTALINARTEQPHWTRTAQGRGEIFTLPLASKLLLLVIIKFATRDPSGFGIQMEAGRPGWYDALNGLPGLFGSSIAETYELLRLVKFLMAALEESPREILLPSEAQALLNTIRDIAPSNKTPYEAWVRMTDGLEDYRKNTRLGFEGTTFYLDAGDILHMIQQSLQDGIMRAEDFSGEIPPTYFIHQAGEYSLLGTRDPQGNPHIEIHEFFPVAFPEFLEGCVRRMKISTKQEAWDIYYKVRNSSLYDSQLQMYKVNASLKELTHEIGRARAFTPGWLENESIWCHMAFKYLLEIQKAGLYDQFFNELTHHLPAFMEVQTYGRSPLENSSFIVSSAHPDQALHGTGFVARLSGSTAEFLTMWVLMTSGKDPFRLEEGNLVLALNPALPGWLFNDKGEFEFRFLGSCQVKIHNPRRLDTYSEKAKIDHIILHTNGQKIDIPDGVIKNPLASRVRNGEIEMIELFY